MGVRGEGGDVNRVQDGKVASLRVGTDRIIG